MSITQTIIRFLQVAAATLLILANASLAEAAPFAYIANFGSNNVSVIDTATNTVVATVAVGTNPFGVAVNPAGTRAYVTNQASNSVSVINTATNFVFATVAVGTGPRGVAVNPAGTRAYVANASSNNVSVIDTATNTVVATVVVGSGPSGVAVNPAGTFAYVTNFNGNNVSVINTATNTVVATVAVGTNPEGVAVNPAGTRAYVANGNSNNVSVIDTATNTVVATVAVGTNPNGVAVNPAGTRAYVTNVSTNNVSVIDTATNTVVATVSVGTNPTGVAVNPTLTAIVPGAPTIGSATAGNGFATVTYTPPVFDGGSTIFTYTATSTPGGITGSTTGGPILVSGLTNGIAYTFTVTASNTVGTSAPSAASNSVTPSLPSATYAPPAGLTFGMRTVGVVSPSMQGTFTNTSSTTLFLSGVSFNGGGSGFMVLGSSQCLMTASLAPGTFCTFDITANPNALGVLTDSVRVNTTPAHSATPTALPLTVTGVPPAPAITSANTAIGVTGAAFTYSITATNTPTSFGVIGLPAGLAVNTSTGVISGAPSVTGTSNATITATNGGGTGSQTLTITVTAPPNITSTAPAVGTVGVAYSHTFTATGTTPMTWSIATGTVPAGLTLNATSGVLSGTPTTANSFAFTIQAANGTTPNATMTFTILINPPVPVITSPLAASGVAGSAFTYSITATNSPTSFGATGLPAGLSVNISTGVISGIPSVTGTFAATIAATNGSGSGTQALSITITAASVAPTITSTAPPMGTVGLAYSHTFTATGTTPIAWTIASGALPAGLSLGPTTGVLSGMPTAAGTFSFVVQAANGTAFIASQNATVSIAAATVPPTITSALPANGTVGVGYTHSFMATGTTPFTWTLAAGSFPPGVTLNASTGVLSGIPTAAGAFAFSVQAANGTAPNATQSGTIAIAAAALPPTLTLSLSSPTTTPGIAVGLVFNFSNPGAAALSAGAFTFTYPAGVVTATVPTITNTCGGSVTSVAGSTSLNAGGLVISPMGSCAIGVSVSSATTGGYTFTFPAGGLSASTGTNAVGSSAILTVTAVASPAVTLAPSTVNFGSRTVNTTSPATVVTLTNSGTANLTISSITSSGDFGFTSTCPIATPPITAGGTCAINITFTPLTVAALNGSISVVSNAPGSPHTIALSGTGSASAVPGIAIAPAALTFGAQTLNTTSASQFITITNTGFANLILSSIAVATPFSRTTVSPTATPPDCASSLAPGSSCQIGVVFTATSIGTVSGLVSITDNAAGSPHTVTLTGTGTPIPVPVISLSSPVSFGDQIINSASSSRTVTISNTGTATLTISAITLTGTNATNFTLSGQSGCTSIAASGTCNLTLSFTPTTTGAKTAQINLTSNAQNAATVNSISLTGNGILAPRAIVNFSATAVGYGNVIFGGATPNQIITLTNIGGQAMSVTSIVVTGDFIQTNNCGSSLAPLATCTINIIFTPLGQGVRFGEFILNSSSATSPDRIQLSGTGCRWFSQAQSRFFLTSCG